MFGIESFLIGTLGLTPEVAYGMTPRQIAAASVGYREKQKGQWARTLRLTGAWGDKLTVKKLFGPQKTHEEKKKEFGEMIDRFAPALDQLGIEYKTNAAE